MPRSALLPTWVLLGILAITPGVWLAQKRSAQSVEKPAHTVGDINVSTSRIYTHVFKKTRLGHEHAVEGWVQRGHLILGARKVAGEIVFDMRSFKADAATARTHLGLEGTTDASTQTQVNANMLGSTVLDVARYPTAVFKIDSATLMAEKSRRGLPQYRLAGSFTLHGTTRPLIVSADAEERNGSTHLRGGFNIQQSSFGIKPFTKALGVIGVADQLSIYGDLWIAGTPETFAQQPQTQR